MAVNKKAIDPDHYQDYSEGRQWIETMATIPRFRDPEVFKGALELQVRKYMDRCGQKDEEAQEMLKGLWYQKALVAYVISGNGMLIVAQVESILSGKRKKFSREKG